MPGASDASHPRRGFVAADNLDVLAALPDGCVDIVYLDPPYNRGGDHLTYADDVRDPAEAAPGDRAGRHAAWLAMMRPRMEHVRRVLAPSGSLWCSIDDHEVAHLRLLLDELFGEEQRLAQVVVNLNPKGRQLGGGFATSHEYLLVYARDAARCAVDASTTDAVDPRDFPLLDPHDARPYRRLPLRNTNKRFNPRTATTLHYPLFGDPDSGEVRAEPFAGAVEVLPVFGDGAPAVWRWSAALVAQRTPDLECRRVRGRRGVRVDVFQRDWLEPGRRKKLTTIWLAEEVGSTDTAVAELKALVGPVFASPKPTGLLRRVLATVPDDVLVLDPFAGSGATGHAVALANAQDGGTRSCLSVNRPEPVPPGSPAAAAGLATVAEVTRARLEACGGFEELDAAEVADWVRRRPPSSPGSPARRRGDSAAAAGAAPSGGSR